MARKKKKTGANLDEMDDKHREILRRQRPNLRRDLEVKKMLPKLFSVLNLDDEEEVTAEATRRKMVDKLLNILPKKGPKAFDVFVKGLQEIQPFLAAPLLQYSGIKRTCCFGLRKRVNASLPKIYWIEKRRNIRIGVSLQFIKCDANKMNN